MADYKTKLLKHEVENINKDAEKEMCKKFAEFINSLPEIESHLCNGGYIQDTNGTPCCDGDRILVLPQNFVGTLKWESSDRRFVVMDDTEYPWTLGIWDIKKITKGANE